ncbi:hypothetical protein BaRGS_00035568 [Batillaria attramentaria]|uniref:Uncharacterized protein n=1 Tax=Batillaria attramentaria TaxID=370345 RepID=A0ABD0JEG0_9CAEN
MGVGVSEPQRDIGGGESQRVIARPGLQGLPKVDPLFAIAVCRPIDAGWQLTFLFCVNVGTQSGPSALRAVLKINGKNQVWYHGTERAGVDENIMQ